MLMKQEIQVQNEQSKLSEARQSVYDPLADPTGRTPYRQVNDPNWRNKEYSIPQLYRLLSPTDYVGQSYATSWLRKVNIIPRREPWNTVYSVYPNFQRDRIKAEHLASLALEWDREGPSNMVDWLEMVELECTDSTRRDTVREALEVIGGLSSKSAG